jgi:hypothetical protein
MSVIIRITSVILLSLMIAGCYRPVPPPGKIYIGKQHMRPAAPGYLIGKTGYFKVAKGSGAFKGLKNKKLILVFLLGNRYELYTYQNRTKWMISAGTYQYDIDPYRVERSMLNLIGKNGADITLFYSNHSVGTFIAKSNRPNVSGIMRGSFAFKLRPTNQSLRF